MTNFYVDDQGRYIGGYDGAEPPEGAIEVPSAPASAADLWQGGRWVTATVVPQSVPMLNAHLVLIEAGWMPGILAYLDALPEPSRSKALAYFNLALTMERNHALVKGIPAALGKPEAEVDALFVAASALEV